MTDMVKRWLAVGTSADTIRLISVSEASSGPDVFVKLFDYEELAARLAGAERLLRDIANREFANEDECSAAAERYLRASDKGNESP